MVSLQGERGEYQHRHEHHPKTHPARPVQQQQRLRDGDGPDQPDSAGESAEEARTEAGGEDDPEERCRRAAAGMGAGGGGGQQGEHQELRYGFHECPRFQV